MRRDVVQCCHRYQRRLGQRLWRAELLQGPHHQLGMHHVVEFDLAGRWLPHLHHD